MVWGALMGFGVPRARLTELVKPGAILPMWALNTYPMRRHPRTPDAPMCGLHQSYGNTTLDVYARP